MLAGGCVLPWLRRLYHDWGIPGSSGCTQGAPRMHTCLTHKGTLRRAWPPRTGAIYKYDLSFRVEEMYGVVGAARERLASAYPSGFLGGGAGSTAGSDTEHALKVVGYGHLGDGNVHLNISAPRYDARLEALIEPWVYEFTAAHSGSISAEHGLGRMKAPCIGYSKPPEAVRLMRSIKAAFDPQGILNPYKVLPPE